MLRRTPLRRSAPLERSTGPARRTKLSPVSKKRKAETGARRATVAAVVARDGGCVAAFRGAPGACIGPLTAHEVVKRSQGGSHLDPSNCVALCWGHNSWVEDHPAQARALGLVRSSWERAPRVLP